MKKSFVFGLLLAAALGLAQGAGAQVTQEWVETYNGPGNNDDYGRAIAVDNNGNVYITGSSYGGGGTNYDYATIKYDSSGNQLWVKRYNGPGSPGYHDDGASDVAIDRNGKVYVTGESWGAGNSSFDYATIKYDLFGNQLWVARYSGLSVNSVDRASAIAVDSSGNVYITGSTGSSNEDCGTIKYDSLGDELWVARYNGPGNGTDTPFSLVLDDNSVYVTGISDAMPGTGQNMDIITIKYDNAGAEQWVARYDGPASDYDKGNCVTVDHDGNVYVTGYSSGGGSSFDYITIKYDLLGNQIWAENYDYANGSDQAKSCAVDENGNIYVAGFSYGSGTNNDFATIKYNSAGQQQWVARQNGMANSDDKAQALILDDNYNIYVTGYSTTQNVDITTIKYDSSGSQLWIIYYNSSGTSNVDVANSISLDSNANVYVIGYSCIPFYSDYATIKYTQTPLPLGVTLIPLSPPILIPASGGSFNFNASLIRNVSPQAPYTVWCRIKNPDGTYTPPTLGPVTINTPVGVTIARQRSQTVPGSWPAGVYTYLGYVNTTFAYPAIDSSSFPFTKSATTDGGPWITDATCTGEPFPGEEFSSTSMSGSGTTPTTEISPNPFNPLTTIRYNLSTASQVSLTVYDTAGRLVTTLIDGWQEAGTHNATFDGSKLASGIYLAKLEAGEFKSVQKLVLMK
jgi:uncharacterized delta-60 repeat protein